MQVTERLEARVERFLRTGEGDFEALALEVFARQWELNRPYQAYCRRLEIEPAGIRRWQDIPAVPIQAFKSAELATFPIGQAAAVFESSRTTGKTPSRHYMKTLQCYETAVESGFAPWLLAPPINQRVPCLILTPPPGEAPRSSLSWMMEVVKRKWGAAPSAYFVRQGRLDELWLATLLAKIQTEGRPSLLLGTTIAFLAFFDHCRKSGRRYRLPPGSRLMDTGGMKTEKREISRPEFVSQVEDLLGIPESACFNEYGMCEMSSQFYGRGRSSQLKGPPWVRTLIIDPLTGAEAAPGTPGLLRHFDLANVDSVMAIQTEDMGIQDHQSLDSRQTANNELPTANAFTFLGRAPAAELRGCSLTADAFLR